MNLYLVLKYNQEPIYVMFRYQIIIEYDGTSYSGWQSQKNAKSVQKEIEKILSKILKKKLISVVQAEQMLVFTQKTNLLILIIKNIYQININ